MTLARTLTRASAVLSCLLAVLMVLIAGLSPHATASAHPATHTRADTAHAAPRATDTRITDTRASDTQASDTQASDTQASDTQASDTQASDTQASDTQASDTRVQERVTASAPSRKAPSAAAKPAGTAAMAERVGAGQSCQNHEPVQGPLHVSHLRLRGIATDNRPLHGPDCVLVPHLDGNLTLTVHRPHGFDARPRCLTRRTAAQTSTLLQVFRC
ncbi:hypothetical protein [Actinomadura miaoliensis]|uniref:Uncharacterized protein n=1 Tax=Actinomadura miaoliensis TaxID=430685 RepID=A0ABP7VMV5_9ACTN